ncbi:MAG: Crp/Fnr family transcriptional regulator [Acidobacteriota bacterium]
MQPRTTLLKQGSVARSIFFIQKGCLRVGYCEGSGKDITFQFFFENDRVASIESFMSGEPSDCYIEAIEESTLFVLAKNDFDLLVKDFPEIKELFFHIAMARFTHYARLFRSYISHKPKERYLELLKTDPRIIERVPQHYIASYLGITPVSLSRIRNSVSRMSHVSSPIIS